MAWRDGEGRADDLAIGPLQLRAQVTRTGQAEDYLVWRFAAIERLDLASEITRHLDGPAGRTLSHAGVMAALVNAEGRLRVANQAFLLRALGEDDAGHYAGRDVAPMLRIDDGGALYFAREGDRATPVRMLQIPLAPADTNGPVLLALLDEEMGPADRGTAQTYVETLLSLLPFGLAMVDRDGRFLYMNRAFVRAANLGEGKMPRYPGDIVVGEDKGPLADMIRRHSSGQQVGGDLSIRLAGQSGDPVSMRVVGVRGLGEAAVLLSLKDSSEESRLKRQVAQASKMQAVGQLAGGVAHDFNNILTAVLGACDLMLMRHAPGDSDYDDIQQIRSNANRAASLTRQLLAFSRQQTLRPQILQLPDVISEVSHLLKRLIGETVQLAVHHGRGLGAVRADPGQLEQVIINLAVNARDAMPGGGTLTIETYPVSAADVRQMGNEFMPPADYCALKVSDTGTGISADVLPKIFEPFFTTKDVGQGDGPRVVDRLRHHQAIGGVYFCRQRAGAGDKVFTIYLPVHRVGTDTPVVAPPPAKPKKSQWGHRHHPARRGRGYGARGGRTRADPRGLYRRHRIAGRGGARTLCPDGQGRPDHQRRGDADDGRPRDGTRAARQAARPAGAVHVGLCRGAIAPVDQHRRCRVSPETLFSPATCGACPVGDDREIALDRGTIVGHMLAR